MGVIETVGPWSVVMFCRNQPFVLFVYFVVFVVKMLFLGLLACHPEQREGSAVQAKQILHFVQNDNQRFPLHP